MALWPAVSTSAFSVTLWPANDITAEKLHLLWQLSVLHAYKCSYRCKLLYYIYLWSWKSSNVYLLPCQNAKNNNLMSIHFPARIFNCYLTPCKNAGNFLVSIYVLEKIMEIYYVHLLPCKKAVKSLFYCKMLYIYYVYLLPCKNAEHFLMSIIFSMAI